MLPELDLAFVAAAVAVSGLGTTIIATFDCWKGVTAAGRRGRGSVNRPIRLDYVLRLGTDIYEMRFVLGRWNIDHQRLLFEAQSRWCASVNRCVYTKYHSIRSAPLQGFSACSLASPDGRVWTNHPNPRATLTRPRLLWKSKGHAVDCYLLLYLCKRCLPYLACGAVYPSTCTDPLQRNKNSPAAFVALPLGCCVELRSSSMAEAGRFRPFAIVQPGSDNTAVGGRRAGGGVVFNKSDANLFVCCEAVNVVKYLDRTAR